MPMRPITVKANFQLDTSAARAQLQGLQKELSSITKGATMDLGITPQITQAIKEAQQLKSILAEATDFSTGAFDLSKFDAALKQQNMSIQQFKQSLQTLGPEGEKAFNSLATTIASAQVPLKRTSQGVQELMTAFGNTMRWQATSMAMHKIVGTIQQAYSYAQNLDKSLTNIQIVTGHNADYMRNFAREANKAAQALSASTLEYTNASLIYYQQGLGDKEVAKRAETTLKLAKVTGESASKVSQQMTAVWNNFSNGVDNLERYADVMTALGATTASSSSEIAKGLEKFASVTKTIGLSYDYAASALATVTAQTRQSADSVGTAFKTLFSRLESLNLGETLDDSTTLNKYSEALLKAGVNIMDVNGHLKDMDTILDELGAQWNNLNKAQQVALSQTVGGVRNYTSLITLMDNWEDFQNNVVTSQLAEGTLQKQADIYAQSWEAAQQRVKTASQGIYDTLISSDFFKGFNNAFAGVLNTINKTGQTLGSTGSLAGILNFTLGMNREKIATGIDNTIVNTLGQTEFGQRIYQRQQENLLKNFTQGIFDTGTPGAVQRQGAFQALIDQQKQFNKQEYKTKAEAILNQSIMQQRVEQVKSFMNSTIDTEQLSLKNNLSQRALSEKLAGTYGLGNFDAKTVQENLLSPFLGGGQNGYKNFRMGSSGYINNVFANPLEQLAAMDLTAGPGSRAEALAMKLQAQAINAFKSESILDLITSNDDLRHGMEMLRTLPVESLMDPKNLSIIQDYFSKFNVSQLQKYQEARAKLDEAFLEENPDAILKDSTTGKEILKDGKKQVDSKSDKGAAYLASMKDAETTAEQYLQRGLIDEQTYQDIKSGNKHLQDIIKQQDQNTTSFGNAAVSTGQMISSMAMATNSIINFHQQIKDGTATATSMFTTMGSTGMALGQIASVLGNKDLIDGLGISVKSLGMIAGGAALLGVGALTVYKAISARDLTAKSEYTNENKIALSAMAKENEQKYEQFLPVISQYQNTLDKLTSLQQGTSAYTASLIAANNQAREIIETYNLEAGKDYSYKNGAYNFSAEQIHNIDEQLLETSKRSNTYAQLGISANAQINSLLEKRRYDKDERIATINSQDYNEQYSGYIDTTWQYDAFQKDLQQIDNAHEIINSEAYQEAVKNNEKRALAQKADFQVALESTISSFESISDAEKMAVIYLGENTTELDNYANEITEKIGPGGITRDWLGKLRSEDELREAYLQQFGVTAAADATAQSIAAELDAKVPYDYLVGRIKAYSEGENKLDDTFLSDFVNINTADYKTMKNTFEKVQNANFSKETQEVYNTFIQKALTDSIKAQDSLVQAMMANSQFNGQEYVKIAQQLQEGAANFSTQQLETLTNYVNSFTNNFGEEAGKAVFDALTNNQQGWNQNYYEALQKISLDNSISALADLTQFNNQRINADLVEPLGKLRSAIIEDVESRGGLAKTLFTSSEFTKVFDSLSEQYKATGEITSQNIADLAKKNDIIGDYMTVSGANEQAIADLFEIVASGDLSVENITPAIEHFVQRASGAEGAQQEALDVAAEQDLSDSITNMDKWAQNIGKAWYTGRTHDVLGDRPVLEGLKMVLTPEDYAKYMRTLAVGAYGGTTSSMLNSMKGNMANAYAMLAELEGSGKKKGKGGGGMDTVYEYLAKEGIFDESGIQYDTNTGNFILGADFGPRYGNNRNVTFSGLKDYIIESLVGSDRDQYDRLTGYGFVGKGYSREQAEDLAAMMLGSMSASSMGTVLSASGLVDAANTFFGELKGEGQKQGNYITPEQYNALFNQYSDVLATMKMEQVKDKETGKTEWKLREATVEEMQAKDFKGVTATEWRQYFVQEAKKAGSAIIGIKGSTQLGKQDAKAIGEAIAGASQGTIKATQGKETDAIVQAAIAAGVQMYRDYSGFGPDIRGDHFAGQSLDYDQLQNFYNNVLGLSTEILNEHLGQISEDNGGLAFTHKWTDAYGVEHNVNSRDYGGNTDAFVRSVEQENNFSNAILEFQRDQWISNYFNDDTIWKKYGDTANASGAMRYLDDMFRQAQQEAQAAASSTTQSNPIEGENGIKPEGEGETPPEGEGETNANVTSTTGMVTTPEGAYEAADVEAQAKVGKYNNYTYRGNAEAEKVYRYNLLHPTLTPAEAYDKVHSGKVDVDAEWREKYGEETTPTYGTPVSDNPYGTRVEGVSEEYQAFKESGLTREQWNAYKASGKTLDEYKASTLTLGPTFSENPYGTKVEGVSEEYQAFKASGLTREEWDAYKASGKTLDEYKAEKVAEETESNNELAKKAIDTQFGTNTVLVAGENADLTTLLTGGDTHLTTEQAAEEAAAQQAAEEAAAQQAAEEAAAQQAQAEALSAYETENALSILDQNPEWIREFNASMLNETAAQFVTRKQTEEAAAREAEETADRETEEKEPSNKEMREFLRENGYTSATINTAMREEGVSLKDLYQRVNSALTETNKQLRNINDNTGQTADNTGEALDYQEEKAEQEQTDQNTGKTDAKGKDAKKDQNIFGNTGNTTIINEGSGSDNGEDDGGYPWKPGGTTSPFGKTGFDFTKIGLGIVSAFGIGASIGKGKGTNQNVTGKSYDSGGKTADSGSGGGKIEVSWKQVASGQNNGRLLSYASGKEGHIAVTGELGPELRVKSDGSMDILGKTGREYAWVEPDDKIYTASQSAGILKSNKIPGLEGLAKGINNFIPGYLTGGQVANNPISTDRGGSSSSGGGGGSGSSRGGGGGGAAAEKDPRYDPQTLKIRDVLERYYTILQQIDNITKAVERFSKVADRAWGRERIRAIEQQNEMQQKQYEAQKKYIAEIEEYLDTDQSALTTMIQEFVTGWNEAAESNEEMEKISWAGAQYDENGVLTNYREFVEKLTEQYNQNAASANQETQYKFQEQLKDIQMYTDTLNLYEEQKDALEDIKNAILDAAVKTISYEVEYKLELSGDADRILNFQADKYKDDVYQAAKYLELLDKRADETRKNLVSVQDGIFKTLGTYAGEAMRTGATHNLEELGIYGTEQFKLDEELTDADEEETEEARLDRLRKVSTKVNEWLEQLREKNADAAAEIDKMITHSEEEGQEDIITNYEEVIRRLNAQVDYTAVRAKVDEWLEELRGKNAEAAAEIDKIVQRNEAGEIINYRDVIERLNEENVRLSDEAIAVLMEDQDKFFEWMSDFRSNPGWVDFTTEHKDLLTNYMDQIYQYLQSLQETYEQTIEQLGDSIKATSKQMDAAVDEFDYYGDVYKTFGNIVDLTNRHMTDVSQDFFDTLNNKSMDNAINKIKGTVTNYHLLQNELAEVTKQYNEMQARANAATGEEQIYLQQSADKLKEQLDIANSQYEDAHKAFLSSWEDALSKMAENYKAAVEEASRNFEQGFSPLFNTLALLQAQFDREKALGDLYVDNYQRIHDLNKLNRDIQLSIDDTDNLKGKERLRDLQAEINQLQEDGTELSEYDLDILDKKYKLELARQALEDAKDAKSMVRLARDNNGNWSYVYTANQDDVEKAEQDYEDAIREMEQANEDYIDNIQDQILQVQQEAQQAILALQPEDFATYEDYLAAVNNIQNSMYQTLDFLRSQLNNAFGNNEWLDPYIVDRYGVNDHDLTTDFGDTTLAGLLDNPDIDKAMKKAKQNFEDTLKKPVLDAFIEYSARQDEVYKAAEHDIATIGKDFQDEMESIADSSNYQVEVVENLSQRVQDAFNDMAAVVDEKTKKHLDEVDELVNRYEKLVEALTEVKRLSGENLPAGMTQEIGTTDTWREIEDLENLLKENGHIRVLEDLTNLNKEDVVYRDEKLKDATEKIDDWVAALGDATSDIAEGIERNDAGQITNYKDIIQKLADIEQTDENKETLKNIKKWKEKDDTSVLMDDHQVLTDEGLWTYLVAGDDYTKQYLKDKIDNAAKNGAIDVGADVDETEKAKVEDYLKLHGIVYVKWDGGLEKFESMDDWLAWYEKHKYVPPASDGGGGNTPWTTGGWTKDQLSHFSGGYIDTGGYTGRWQSADTGMYTGEWPSGSVRRNGRLAWLHQKELVLNAHDTENFLDAMQIVRQLDNLTNWMANGLGDLIMPNVQTENSELEQNVHIEAEFPNVTNHNEIEQAFNNLVNMASQYANRK